MMILCEEDLKVLEEVPAGKWHEVMDFARSLTEEHKQKISSGKKREKPRLWGALEGQVWMSDDFNDPMDFVSPEEMRVLEAMRSQKKTEPNKPKEQEAAV